MPRVIREQPPESQFGLQGHINAAEHWVRQAGNFEFPNPIRTECLQLASIHASLAQALALTGSQP